jgi:hypothetical protein
LIGSYYCRKESELFSDWRESRDKLVVDYKRKSKDVSTNYDDLALLVTYLLVLSHFASL